MSVAVGARLDLHRSLIVSGKLWAFLIHLGASACVVGMVGALMLWLWFPQPWFMHDGGWAVYRIILLVDVVLGPLLTLIAYRRGKAGLRRDLTLIVALQLGALAFGSSVMFQHRPAFIVYADRNFFTVTWREVRDATQNLARLQSFIPARGPGFVVLRVPRAPGQQAMLRALQAADGAAIVGRGDYYDAMTAADWTDAFARGPRIEALARSDADIRQELARFRRHHAGSLDSFGFVPVVCRREVIMLVLDRKTLSIVDWLT